MLHVIRRAVLIAAVLVFAAVQSPSSAWSRTTHFRIVYGGFAQVTGGNPLGNPPTITIHGTAVGRDALFGVSTAMFDQTVVFSNPNQIKDGRFTFTAIDGSVLTGSYHGPTSPPTTIGLTSGLGTFVVTGGSGRFENAHGDGSYTVQAQLFPQGSDPAASVQTTFEGDLTR